MPEFSFKKGERLSGSKTISSLFQTGRNIFSFPVRIIFHQTEIEHYPVAVAISVPKRLFKNAVDRNLLKRRIREAYRLNKPAFYSQLLEANVGLKMVIQFQHHKMADYNTIENGLTKALEQVIQKLEKNAN